MSQNAAKYKAYKFLLESDISPQHRDLMLEKLGIFQQLKSFFGGAKEMGGEMLDVVKNKAYQKQLVMAQQNMEEALQDLRDIAKKAGKDDAFVNALLQSFLKGSGVDPSAIASASPSGEGGGESGGDSGGGQLVVTPKTIAKTVVAAPLIAAVTDKDVGAVVTQVEKQKPNPATITGMIASAAAKSTGVDEKIALKAVQALVKSGKLKAESRFRDREGLPLVFERWQQLAGFPQNLLVEGQKEDKWMAMVDKGDFKSAEDLQKAFKEKMGKATGFPNLGSEGQKRILAKLEEKLKGGGSEKSAAGLPAGAAEKEPTTAAVAAVAKEVGIDKSEAEKYKKEAEDLAKKLQSSETALQGFKDRVLQAVGLSEQEFNDILTKYGVEAALMPLIAAQKKEATTKPMGTPAAAGSSEFSKTIREAIPTEELDDASLTKLTDYLESLIKKAEDKAAELKKTQSM